MNTIPNTAPKMTAEILTLEEVKNYVHDDDYAWVEIHAGNFGAYEDETFYLRADIAMDDFIDFSIPGNLLHCEYDDYGTAWRVWSIAPEWENGTPWEAR